MNELRSPSGKTTYFEAGRGRPLVLVHGFPLSKAMWLPQIEGLQDVARVLAPDLPGFGGSAGLGAAPTVEGMADRVAEFLDELQVREPVVLGGLSMGGYVTLAFTRRHATRLRGLLLADTKSDPDDEPGKAGREKMIALARESGPRAVVEQMLPKLIGPTTVAQRPAIADEVRAIAAAQTTSGVVDALQAMRDRPDSASSLAGIAVPTLVVVGEQDAITPPAKSEALAQRIPGARLHQIADVGHLSNLENAAAFNAAARDFLAGLS